MQSRTELCVIDLGSVEFRLDDTDSSTWVCSAVCANEELARVEVPAGSTHGFMAAACLDQVLATAKVLRETGDGPVVCPIGLYNPYTFEVAVGALPKTVTYTAAGPVELPGIGVVAFVRDGCLHIGSGKLPERQLSRAGLALAAAAHHS